ncbi:MAG: alpha/beta hydrolase, partial [Pseudomonas helleri]
DRAIEARMKGMVAVSREAAELLAQRGLMPVPGGYSWRSDSRLTLPSPLRLTDAQAMSFVRRVTCPTTLVVAEEGMLASHPELLDRLPFTLKRLAGGHHLHLNDEAGATLVADCFNRFFVTP